MTMIDGALYRNMILAGANRVISKQADINKINVFPVPDGDTGSNMAYTFSSIANAIKPENDANVGQLSRKMAEAAINGALGNSGSILAQFFQGLNDRFKSEAAIPVALFAETASHAAQSAREAIENPVEGTIITVMHDWGVWLLANHHSFNDIHTLLPESLVEAERSLAQTPEKLEILSRNHVVDAGAQGFVHFLQGMNDFLTIGHIDHIKVENLDEENHDEAVQVDNDADIHMSHHENHVDNASNLINQYCTECIIHGKDLNIKAIRSEMARWGNSLVVVGNDHKVKIHVHTNAPEKVFRKAGEYGELLETKADDMWAQYRASINWHMNKKVAVLTDSACGLPQELFVKYNVTIMPLQVMVNNQPYLDGVNITREQFFKHLEDNDARVSTSQAALPDMKTAFDKGLRQADSIVMIPLSSGISGTYNSLKRLRERYAEADIHVIDSKSAAGGQGLVVLAAARAAAEGKSAEEVVRIAEYTAAQTQQFISFKTMKYAVKGGRVKRSTGMIVDTLNLKPVMRFNAEGKIVKAGMAFGTTLGRRKIVALASKAAESMSHPSFIISHVQAYDDALKVAQTLQKRFNLQALPSIVELTPVVATHVGLGGVGIAVTNLQP